MKKNELFSFIKMLVLVLVFSFSVVAVAFTGPTNVPPLDNVPEPLNKGTTEQTKPGDLKVTNFFTSGYSINQGTLSVAQTTQPTTGFSLEVNGNISGKGSMVIDGGVNFRSSVFIDPNFGLAYNDTPKYAENKSIFSKLSSFFGIDSDLFKTRDAFAAESPVWNSSTGTWVNPSGLPLLDDGCGNSCPVGKMCVSGTCVTTTGGGTTGGTTVTPVCGSANGTTTSTAPSTNLCSVGTYGSVTGSGSNTGYWKWNCLSGVSAPASCTANRPAQGGIFNVNGASVFNGSITSPTLSGTGNAYACLDDNGVLFRSTVSCENI